MVEVCNWEDEGSLQFSVDGKARGQTDTGQADAGLTLQGCPLLF